MDSQTAIDLCRQAMWLALIIGAPTLLAGIAIGMLISLLQALTQIQEQTIGVVLKILVMVLVLGYTMPWMMALMMDFTTTLIADIPDRLAP
ncbi:MAG: flagellar biosynthetic protein FliQ [Thermoguttaceae bacterium]